jgi:hypothetical protein
VPCYGSHARRPTVGVSVTGEDGRRSDSRSERSSGLPRRGVTRGRRKRRPARRDGHRGGVVFGPEPLTHRGLELPQPRRSVAGGERNCLSLARPRRDGCCRDRFCRDWARCARRSRDGLCRGRRARRRRGPGWVRRGGPCDRRRRCGPCRGRRRRGSRRRRLLLGRRGGRRLPQPRGELSWHRTAWWGTGG